MALMDASCNMTQEEVDSACDAIASLSDVPASRNFHAVVDGIRSCLGAKDFVKSGTGPISSSREIRRALSTGEDHINTKPDGRETSQGTIQGNVDSKLDYLLL